jgi:hypothetical protein
MGFPKYFNRDIIALNKRLSINADSSFRELLLSQLICLEFDDQVFNSKEAKICIELLVRILSRFYPKLKFTCNATGAADYVSSLKELARSINSNIEFAKEQDKATFIICASRTFPISDGIPHLFLGAMGWTAKISQKKPLEFGNSHNPFGASISACIAASNIFRFVFKNQLSQPLDTEVEFCAHNYSTSSQPDLPIDHIALDDVNLIGIGAIGTATVWTLSNIKKLTGNISLIDHDRIEESNLQRYVLLKEKNIGKWKVDVAMNNLVRHTALKVNPIKNDWGGYIHEQHIGRCRSRLVAVCIDNKEGRVQIQSSLPKKIINAYTDESRFGISRHFDFTKGACLACLYMPTQVEKSKLVIMVEELNMKGFENLIYEYMKEGKLLDDKFLNVFCSKNQIDIKDLNVYKHKPLADFYIDMICGFKLIKLQGEGQRASQIDAPLSFQSCMAGVMLAAEIVLESMEITREGVRDVTQWQVLEDVNADNPSHYTYLKNIGANCICGDPDFQTVYRSKWNI